MKPSAKETALPEYHDALCATSALDSSRFVACVSAAGAIVWGVFFAVMSGPPSSVELQVVLLVTIHHVGQAVASAIAVNAGAVFALLALAVQIGIAVTILIADFEIALCLFFLTTPVICSACALVVKRRHIEQDYQGNVEQ